MQTKNVYYSSQPDAVIVSERGRKAMVEFPCDVTKVKVDDRTEWLAANVYYIETMATPNLKARVEAEFDAWLEAAKEPVPQSTSLDDVVEAINALTDIIIGG